VRCNHVIVAWKPLVTNDLKIDPLAAKDCWCIQLARKDWKTRDKGNECESVIFYQSPQLSGTVNSFQFGI
jgi:hypothetical protein